MQNIEKLLGDNLVASSSSSTSVVKTRTIFSGKYKIVGLLFSAKWAPECSQFVATLDKAYRKIQETEKHPLEVIFVPCDDEDDAYKDSFASMPWLSIQFKEDDPESRDEIMEKYGIKKIPAFVLLDGNSGELLSTSGKETVENDVEGRAFPWRKVH